MLADILSRYWWTTLLRGIISIMFGIALFALPGISLLTLTLLFGAFAMADGVASIISAFGGRREHEHWWVLLLAGLAGIGAGVLTFFNPGLTTLVLVFYIAIWAIATGLLEVVAAVRLRKEIEGEFWLALAGLVSVAFGVMLMARPSAGALALVWLIAGYAIVFGSILIALSFRARRFVRRMAA